MQRLVILTCSIALTLAVLAGCNDASKVPLNVADPSAAKDALIGSWDGSFVLDQKNAQEELDGETIATLKSIRMSVEFRNDGNMSMSAKMQTPQGPMENVSQGTWEIVERQGDQLTIRSTEANAAPEDIKIRLAEGGTFLMSPPQGKEHIGVIRFQRR